MLLVSGFEMQLYHQTKGVFFSDAKIEKVTYMYISNFKDKVSVSVRGIRPFNCYIILGMKDTQMNYLSENSYKSNLKKNSKEGQKFFKNQQRLRLPIKVVVLTI